ncbi:MAG: sulfotransferase [Acidimicrobiia bacterium]|nr:sulfotransferase [Acidimicrobiia bacterium]
MPSVRVLYITSTPRSGSTLVGNVIGQAEGFVHVGELNQLWFRLVGRPSTTCGCGVELTDCPFWSEVLQRVESTPGFPGRDQMHEIQLGAEGLRGFAHQKLVAADRGYRETVERLYQVISELCDGQVIVDSSKKVGYGAMLPSVPSLDVRFLHLIRDPRGMAASRTRRSRAERGALLRVRSLLADSARWVGLNLAAESLANEQGVRVNYEAFTANPRPEIERALALFMPDADLDAIVDGSTVHLQPTHTVWGNRSRFTTGAVEIVDDQRWTTELSVWERRLATGLPRPFLGRFGYSVEAPSAPVGSSSTP